MRPRPHVSPALVQLRGWITLTAAVICLCGLTQATVFMFANYTSIRQAEVKPEKPAKGPLRVVHAGVSDQPQADPTAPRDRAPTGVAHDEALSESPESTPRSTADQLMSRASAIACGVGTLACCTLCVLTLLGVVVAGGACVPGVERAVTAGVWSVFLALLCMPWADALPSLRIPGIFASYSAMTAALSGTTTVIAGGMGAHVQWVLMPIVAAVVGVGVCVWFRVGVERGIIITAPSELDRAIEREAAELSKQGVTSGVTRSVGALNQAIGEVPASGRPVQAQPINLEHAIENAAGAAAGIVKDASTSLRASGAGRSVADPGYKRLI